MSKLKQYRDKNLPRDLELTWYEDAAIGAMIWAYTLAVCAIVAIPVLIALELVKLLFTGGF